MKRAPIAVMNTRAFILISLLLSGCAGVKPVSMATEGGRSTKHVFLKNYTLNTSRKANVGDPLVQVKDYYETESRSPVLIASNDYRITGGALAANVEYSGGKNERLALRGESGGNYVMVIPQIPLVGFLVSKSGYFTGDAINLDANMPLVYTYQISPLSTRFNMESLKNIDTSAGFTNYELIYTGKSDSSINLLYREYTPDNLARPAFFQNLSYPSNSKTIRFKSIDIQVDEVTASDMTYTVTKE